MFGSNFMQQFGLTGWQDFPLQGTDAQGGMFGFNTPAPDPNSGLTGDMMGGIPGGPTSPQLTGTVTPPQAGLTQPNVSLGAPPVRPETGGSPLIPQSPLARRDNDPPAAGQGTEFVNTDRREMNRG